MLGGIAVSGNLLCLTHTDARGLVLLVDLDEKRLASRWSFAGPDGGYADAAGVAMDAAYNIFVADTRNDRVRRFSPFGKEYASLGEVPDRATGAVSRDRAGILDRPHAVAIHADVIYVSCGDRKLVRGVQRFGPSGKAVRHLSSCGENEGRFGAPRGIYAGEEGIFIADFLHGAIQRFEISGRFISEFTSARQHDEASRPVAVMPISGGDLLVVDQGDHPGLYRFSVGGEPKPLAEVESMNLQDPSDLAMDAKGRIYILDRACERVQRLHPDLSFDELVVDLAEVSLED